MKKGPNTMEKQLSKEELVQLVNESENEFIIRVEFGEGKFEDAQNE